MGVSARHLGVATCLLAVGVITATWIATPDALLAQSVSADAAVEHVAGTRSAGLEGPAARALPQPGQTIERNGADARATWTVWPEGGAPRTGPVCTYDNGLPLDDFGDPASQLSEDPAPPLWQFIAAAADDFELVDFVSPETNCQITMVRAAFSFFGTNSETATPKTVWTEILVTVYANSPLNYPDGVPDNSGGHTGNVVAFQVVPVSELVNEILVGTCRPCFQIDIPVNFVLAKNTPYWLSLVPRHPAWPQSAWCLSEDADLGFSAHAGFDVIGIPFWTEIDGNFGCPSGLSCPVSCDDVSNPEAGANKDLAFALFGQELQPNFGACCDLSTGVCTDVADPANCTGPFEEFTPGTMCAFVSCEAVSGACCDDLTGLCTQENIAACQGIDQRFARDADCSYVWDPPCGTIDPGACCYPDQACVPDLSPAACEAGGGAWNILNDCTTVICPPGNNDCENAWVITGDVLLPFNTIGATTDGPSDSPGPPCTQVQNDVWFKYVAPCTGTLTASLCFGTDYDAAISVYDGCDCPPNLGAQLACDDDACEVDGPAEVTIPVVDGACVLIRIGGDGGATGSGYLVVGCVPQDAGACCVSGGDCLVAFEPDCTGLGGVFTAGVPCSPLVCPPTNDNCADAITVTDGLYPFDTRGASTDGPLNEPGCADANQDIWYDYTATCDGLLTVSLCFDTGFDSVLSVYDGCDCLPNLGLQLACNDDTCGLASEVTTVVTTGTCYKIRVGGSGVASGSGHLIVGCVPALHGACCLPDGTCMSMLVSDCLAAAGVFSPGVPCSPLSCPPGNDDCIDALAITDGTHPFDTRGATTDGLNDSPGGHCTNVNQDIWFAYTATCNGTVLASLCGDTDYDAAIAVYEGCGVCPPTLMVGCNNDACAPGGPSEVEVQVTAGTCYFIRVGGAGSASGSGTLNVACFLPAEGACCHADYSCDVRLAAACNAPGDVFALGEPCSATTCPPPALADCCPGDANADGLLDGEDIAYFVQLLFDQPQVGTFQFCWANVQEADLVIDTADVAAFVQALLTTGPCPVLGSGACCQSGGACQVISQAQCAFQGGAYQGPDSVCNPNPCQQPAAACCFLDGSCQVLDSLACAGVGGLYLGAATSCNPNPCPPPGACCIGDLNVDGLIDEFDIPVLLNALLNPPAGGSPEFCRADVNEDQFVDGLDVAQFAQMVLAGSTCAPSNDDCSGATVITCGGQVTIDNSLATTDPTDPAFSCRAGGPAQGVGTVWLKFTALDTEALVSTCASAGAANDTLVAVYGDVCPPTAGQEIACSEDAGGACDRRSEVCVTGLIVNNDYYIQVASFDEASRGAITIDLACPCPTGACCFGDGTCQVLTGDGCAAAGGGYQGDNTVCNPNPCPPPQPPANDNCQDALLMLCNTQVTVDNTLATTDPADPAFSCRSGGPAQGIGTLWFKFTAIGTDALLSTCGSQSPVTDTLLAVYDSTDVCPFTAEIACSEDAFGGCGRLSELCVTNLTPGETYFVQVATWDEASRGGITLELACPCPP